MREKEVIEFNIVQFSSIHFNTEQFSSRSSETLFSRRVIQLEAKRSQSESVNLKRSFNKRAELNQPPRVQKELERVSLTVKYWRMKHYSPRLGVGFWKIKVSTSVLAEDYIVQRL